MWERNACIDDPSPLDITRGELFGAIEGVKEVVDNRNVSTIYNQGNDYLTKMACVRYATRHIVNVSNYHTGGPEIDPKETRIEFADLNRTSEYEPLTDGSSLQGQLQFAKSKGEIQGYYKVSTIDEIKEAIDAGRYILTGSGLINWAKTKTSDLNVAVATEKGVKHGFAIDGYDKEYFFCRNSYGPNYMDKGYFRVKHKDLGLLFSRYAVIDNKDLSLKERIALNILKKKEKYKYVLVNGRPKRVLK